MKNTYLKITLIFILTCSGCAELPISETLQKSILGSAKSALLKQNKYEPVNTEHLVKDKKLIAYITRTGERVRAHTNVPSLSYRVVDTDIIQGTAGGNYEVFITLGMLNEMQSEAELACFIGHEIQHQVQSQNDPSSSANDDNHLDEVFFIDAPDVVQGYGLHRDIESIKNANYNKGKETDADEEGSVLCAQAGYDAYALSGLEARLAQQIETSPFESVRNLTGTHEQMKDRSAHLKEWLSKRNYREGTGKTGIREFAKAMGSRVNLSNAEIATLSQVSDLEKRTSNASNFESTMLSISKIIRREGITTQELNRLVSELPSGDSFMQEKLVSKNLKSGNFKDRLLHGLSRTLNLMKSSLKFATLSAMVDFYDFCTGRDFMTDKPLSPLARELSALRYGEQNNWNKPLREAEPLSPRAELDWQRAKEVSTKAAEPSQGGEYARNTPDLKNSEKLDKEAQAEKEEISPGDILYECAKNDTHADWYSIASLKNKRSGSKFDSKNFWDWECEPIKAFRVKEIVAGHFVSMQGKQADLFHIPGTVPIDQVLEKVF